MVGNNDVRSASRSPRARLAWLGLCAVCLALLAAGCAETADEGAGTMTVGDLTIADGWVRAAPAAGNSAAYFVVQNAGETADQLVSASTDAADMVQLHETQMEGGVARMVHQPDGIPIPPGASVALEPGGLHVMLMGLTRDLADGETLALDLVFQNAGDVALELPVRAAEGGGMEMGGG